jgi:8-oxo-dGTP pyrophosphatase MutT (NUDIX family)
MAMFSLDKVRDMLPSMPSLTSPSLEKTFNATPIQPTETESKPHAELDSNEPISSLDPQPIDESKPKSNLDLVNECDSFPYFQSTPQLYLNHVSTYYHLRVAAYPDTTLGYVLPSVAEVLRGLAEWELDDDERTLILKAGEDEPTRSAILARTTAAMREIGHFNILKGWRNELYPVYGPAPSRELLFSVERAASALFGIVTYGIHMTAYTKSASGELKIWTPRRSKTKSTYPGMLDNTVAGGMATGENPQICCVREASEEASLPEDLVREKAHSAGTVTYFHIRDSRAGGETRLLQPECQYIFDLELPDDVQPKPSDDEVEEFYLMGVDELKAKLKTGEFKPNCAVVLLDFFIRHGVLNAQNEPDFIEIVSRLHRKLDFPTA